MAEGPSRSPHRAGKYERRFRRRQQNRAFSVAAFVLILVIVSIFMLLHIWRHRPQPRFMFLTNETLAREVEVQALIIRDETSYNAPVGGVFRSFIPQGSKIAKNALLGQMLPPDRVADLRLLNKAENDVNDYRFQLLAEGKAGNARRVFKASNEEVYRSLAILYDYLIQNNNSKSAEIETEIRRTLQQRVEDAAIFDFQDEKLNKLIAERKLQEQKLADSLREIRAEASGVFIRQLDGLEVDLTPERVATISVEELRAFLKTPAPKLAPDVVESGTPLFKLCRSIDQFFVMELPSGYFRPEDQDLTTLRIYCPANGVELEEVLVSRVESGGKGDLVVLKSAANLEAFAPYRSCPLTLYIGEKKGLRVPLSAFSDYERGNVEASLKIIDGGYVHSVKVRITESNDYYALIEAKEDSPYPIEISTMVLLNPDAMQEGEALANTQ